jgi:hypothetical protein
MPKILRFRDPFWTILKLWPWKSIFGDFEVKGIVQQILRGVNTMLK